MPSTTPVSAPPGAREPFTERWPELLLQREGASDLDLFRGVRVVVADAAVISDSVDEEDALLIVRVHRAQTADGAFRDVRDEVAQWLADLLSGHTEDTEQAIRHQLVTRASGWAAAARRLEDYAKQEEGLPASNHAAAKTAEALRDCVRDVERILALGDER